MGMRVIHPTDCPSQIAAPLHPNLIWAVLDGGRSLATRLALTAGDVDAPATSRGQDGRATSHTLQTDRAVSRRAERPQRERLRRRSSNGRTYALEALGRVAAAVDP